MRAFRRFFRPRGDDGFSLLEAVVALSIAGVIFTALGAATISSVKAVLVGRTVQQAGDVAEQAMESMRAFGYDDVSMRTSDLAVNDPLNLTTSSKYDPRTNTVSASGEDLVYDAAGTINPHVSVVAPGGAGSTFTVRKYVTLPQDSTAAQGTAYKRLTVVVSWKVRGVERTRILSSLIANQRSGLPLPDYKFASNGSAESCATPGANEVLGFSLTNNGARDSWTLSSSGGSYTWSYYLDDGDEDNAFDAADTQITGGSPTVGPVETTDTVLFWAVASTQPSTPIGQSTVTFRVTSVAQTSYFADIPTTVKSATVCTGSTATATATPTSSASSTAPAAVPPTQPTSCAASGTLPTAAPGSSATAKTYYMPNGSANVDNTTAASVLTLNKSTVPSSATLWNYSTDLSPSTAGRYLALTGTSVATTADWRYQFTGSTKFVGTGTVKLWGMPASGLSTASLGFTVAVQKLTSAGVQVGGNLATVTVPAAAWGCAGMKPFAVSVNFGSGSGTSFAANEVIAIKVTALGSDALLGYDTTTYPAAVVLPVKQGG